MGSPPGQADSAAAILLALPSSGGEGGGDDLLWAPAARRPLLAWSVAACEVVPAVSASLLLVAPERLTGAAELIARAGWQCTRPVSMDPMADPLRGALDALDALAARVQTLVIHDAARPLVTPELIADVLAAAQVEGMVVAVEPVKETIKRVEGETVAETLPRGELALLQTPLAIRRDLLDALLAAPTPELATTAGLVAGLAARALAAGTRVATVSASHEQQLRVATVSASHEQQLRVASAADLAVADALLRQRDEPA